MTPSQPDYCTIPLTKGQVAIVDKSDYERLSLHKWFAQWNKGTRSFYAVRRGPRGMSQRRSILMHREVLVLDQNDPREGDHAMHNTLDNRRYVDGAVNLRIATRRQQQQNQGRRTDNTSGYKGVSLDPGNGKYRARIRVENRRIHLGYRDTAKQAFDELYAPAALMNHGDFANLGS